MSFPAFPRARRLAAVPAVVVLLTLAALSYGLLAVDGANRPPPPADPIPAEAWWRAASHGHWWPQAVLLPPVTALAARSAARFSEALIEDVTIGLCALRSVSIIAPHTAAQISLQADRAATYERHKISYILETRLRDEGDSHTLFVQLIFVHLGSFTHHFINLTRLLTNFYHLRHHH